MEEHGDTGSKGALPLGAVVVALLLVGGLGVWLSMPHCVVAGTLIGTPDGPRPIEALEVGDAVWCSAPDGERTVGRVTDTRAATSSSYLVLHFENGGALRVTSEHPISTPGGYVAAGQLDVGAAVHGAQGTLRLSEVETGWASVGVHDLSVSPYPNFFAAGVLVHNKESRLHANEASAIGALKAIVNAQALFREGDKDGDGKPNYGTLAQLGNAGFGQLIDSQLASGLKGGYVFEVRVSSSEPEVKWFATARPEKPGESGGRCFAVNHEGVLVFHPDRPVRVSPTTCELPADATPVGR